ncbi:hypothetical protein EDC56_2789 [Sinobacterium caligoides]|uniref:GTP-binding protein n=1 Tax=Sinobacterium caligoides TaxID=933926 RepID=A0A3N2DK22_9GAMM|nr:DUF465 domain-containing protein [Sinobacterium caligoides]ROS00153.1 hypothetical protein EDC56_2789 [Sinobacterium caligoides]
MSVEKHDLLHELPQHKESIRFLKMNDNRFCKLFDEYHDADHEVHRIEQGVETPSDQYTEQRKKIRLSLKDQLYQIIQQYEQQAELA